MKKCILYIHSIFHTYVVQFVAQEDNHNYYYEAVTTDFIAITSWRPVFLVLYKSDIIIIIILEN